MSGSRKKKKPKAPKPWKPKLPYARMRAGSNLLELRPFRASDYPEWLATFDRLKPKQNEFDPKPRPRKKRTRPFFAKMLLNQRKAVKRGIFIFPVFERSSGHLVGCIDLFVFDLSHRTANLGYVVHNNRWGEGIAPEASRLALDLSFSQLALKRVEASCELHNKASARVALKAGMFEEGMRRKFPIPSGMKDLYVFGMNSIDWKKIRQRRKRG